MNLENILSRVEKHVIDATAFVVASQPVYAFFELYVGHVPPQTSLGSRLWSIGTTYAGVGAFVSFGREWWKSRAHINTGASEKKRIIHDMGYKAAFNFLTQPITYVAVGYFTGDITVEGVIGGTLATTVVAFFSGGYECYALDAFRELWGIHPLKRLPVCVQRMKSTHKKGLVTLFSVASCLALYLLYAGKAL